MERLHTGLRTRGIDSRALVGRKTTRSPHSKGIGKGRLLSRAEQVIHPLTKRLGLNDVHHLNSFRAKSNSFAKNADLVHVHGTHGWFNYLALPGLARDKPMVFTLHDMWPMTGHCCNSLDCERWATGCGECPYLDTHPAVQRDNTAQEWRFKESVYERARPTFVAVSRWLAQKADRGLMAPHRMEYIANGMDLDSYQPIDKQVCREAMGIGDVRYAIIFVALSLHDENKGGPVVAKTLASLPDEIKRDTCLILFGDNGKELSDALGMRTLDLGYVRNDRHKAIAYSAADLCFFPTRFDNLPLVLQESLSCGTPMLSSRVGGVPEVVREGVTGHLAQAGDSDEFLRLLQKMLLDEEGRRRMGAECRSLAERDYGLDQSLDRHIELYDDVLAKHGK